MAQGYYNPAEYNAYRLDKYSQAYIDSWGRAATGWGQVHISDRYTVATLSIEDNEEVENEIEIDICCSSCLKISSDKFTILRNACINSKTFLVPKAVNSKAAFLTRVFTHNIEIR